MAGTHRLRVLALAAVLCCAASLLGASPAYAHDALVSTVPADGAAVPAPARVAFQFSDVVLDRFNEIVVTGPDGRRYDQGRPQVLDSTISVELAPLPVTGRYTAAYRVVSADGHPVTGQITFTVTAVTPGAAQSPGRTSAAAGPAVESAPSGTAMLGFIAAGAVLVVLLVAVTETIRRRRRHGGATDEEVP
jgi:hypothetical protein